MNATSVLLAGVGGFIGSTLRYCLASAAEVWVQGRFPLGTLVVNVLGCLVIGAFWSLVEYRQWFGPETRVFVTIGILGGFTTFSAFGYETFNLLLNKEYLSAVTNVTANVLLGTAAVAIGWIAAKALAS